MSAKELSIRQDQTSRHLPTPRPIAATTGGPTTRRSTRRVVAKEEKGHSVTADVSSPRLSPILTLCLYAPLPLFSRWQAHPTKPLAGAPDKTAPTTLHGTARRADHDQ